MNNDERQRKENQITHFSFPSMAMLQTIGSSDCIYESYLKTLLQNYRFHQMSYSNKGFSDNLASKGAMAFSGIKKHSEAFKKVIFFKPVDILLTFQKG